MSLYKDIKAKALESQGRIHKIKNSLAVILSGVHLVLSQKERLSEDSQKYLKEIEKEVWKIDKLLKEN